jgi:hypothetical protein
LDEAITELGDAAADDHVEFVGGVSAVSKAVETGAGGKGI